VLLLWRHRHRDWSADQREQPRHEQTSRGHPQRSLMTQSGHRWGSLSFDERPAAVGDEFERLVQIALDCDDS